jgi:hypothetical protein
MVRMQVYLTEEDQAKIQWLAGETGKTKSELVRQAIERLVGQFRGEDHKSFLRQAKGLWKDRTDLPDFTAIRSELDRTSLQGRWCMAEKVLLDTDVLIDYLRDYPAAVVYLESLPQPLLVSAITVAELYSGVRELRGQFT